MLQVISKKFFKSSNDPETYYETERKAIVYSNICTFHSIETTIATLERIETYKGITTYLMTYKNVLEKQRSATLQLHAVGDNQIVNDFLCCCTFWFQGIFSSDRFYIERLTRLQKEGIADSKPPSKILSKFFSLNQNIHEPEIESFKVFINKLIGLKRETYVEVIKVLRQFQDAIFTINTNIELSYTMFVATIETLTQNFDNYESSWLDCPENMVKRLEAVFEGMPQDKVNQIKKIIIEETHNKLSRRYEAFCLKYTKANYFRENAIEVQNPIRKSYLKNSIKGSYILRSKYVHTLQELPDMLKLVGETEVFLKGKNVFFTFSGITRFSRYIIYEFINSCEILDKEEVNYFNELPGFINVKLAPELWIFQENSIGFDNLTSYSNEFLAYYINVVVNNKSFLDLSKISKKIEVMYKSTNNKDHKLKLLMIYVLYNSSLLEEYRIEGYGGFIENNQEMFNDMSIENIIVHLLTFNPLPWNISDIERCYTVYDTKRFWINELKLPQLVEVILLIEIANMYLNQSDTNKYFEFIEKAIDEKPGDQFLIQLMRLSDDTQRTIEKVDWIGHYFGIKEELSDSDETMS